MTQTHEGPIIFKAPIVRAILTGTKTQMRRVIKNQYFLIDGGGTPFTQRWDEEEQIHWRKDLICPFGRPGDRLWVRETWAPCEPKYCDGMTSEDFVVKSDNEGRAIHLLYRATEPRGFKWNDDPESRWLPSIHMPRWASRITLEITDVRVERLQDISEEDARAEGLPITMDPYHGHKAIFPVYWDSINRRAPWSSNPWVWVIEFKRLQPTKENE